MSDHTSNSLSRRQFIKAGAIATSGLVLASCSQALPTPITEPTQAAPTPTEESPTMPLTPTLDRMVYRDPTYSFEERVNDLVSRMTVEEKVSQMGSVAPAVERLGVPQYNWWNEGLHGVARAGIATVFPQSIGLASTWNTDLIYRMAQVISDEARAKHHEAIRQGVRDLYTGLTLWCPNVNIFRDPRWGRGQETYGEDPYLTSQLAVPYIKGLQGNDPRYLKTVATPKHFAVHSGPEDKRHYFNAEVSQRDLDMTYLPAFKASIVEAKAYSIMGAYNRVNGEACCASPTLLQKILRDTWGFDGFVVSDCGAVDDIYSNHRLVKTPAEAAALAVKHGCDLECGCTYDIPCDYGLLSEAVEQGLLSEADLDRSVKRLFMARFKLGMFDPDEQVPYAQIPFSVVDSREHRELALEVARQSLVLLKNENSRLPLDKDRLKSIAVIGPNAAETLVLSGNYMGTASEPVSVLAGIRSLVGPDVEVTYAQGCELIGYNQAGFAEAIQAAEQSDIAVVVLGLSQLLEGEQDMEEGLAPGVRSRGDRRSIEVPIIQEQLLEAIHATGTPVILVLINGSALAVNWADEHVPAVLEAWYPGQAGGTAIAEALFGVTNPGGRLPVTFYRATTDLPPIDDYCMEQRTYRYFAGQPLYAFGHGLSYTTFTYRDLLITPGEVKSGETVSIQVEVENTGDRLGDEVVQLYVKDVEASLLVPQLQLQGFARLRLAPGQKQIVQFTLSPEQLSFVDDAGTWLLEPGEFKVWIGGRQPDLQAGTQPANVLEGQFTVV